MTRKIKSVAQGLSTSSPPRRTDEARRDSHGLRQGSPAGGFAVLKAARHVELGRCARARLAKEALPWRVRSCRAL